jgi:hypothetical protein
VNTARGNNYFFFRGGKNCGGVGGVGGKRRNPLSGKALFFRHSLYRGVLSEGEWEVTEKMGRAGVGSEAPPTGQRVGPSLRRKKAPPLA